MFKISSEAKTKVELRGYYENKRIMELEFNSLTEAELLISRIKSHRWISIYNEEKKEYGKYFISQMDFQIDPTDSKVSYYVKFHKYSQ